MAKLSAKFVATVTKTGKYPDGNHGLALLVKGPRSKSWIQRFTIAKGNRVDRGLGSTKYVTLKEARAKAYENARLGSQGTDPKAIELNVKQKVTFEHAAIETYKELFGTYKNPKDYNAFINSLRTHVFPTLGNSQVAEVTSANIRQLILQLRRKIPSGSKKVQNRIHRVMNWAVAEGIRPDNPAAATSLALPVSTHVPKHRKSLPYQNLGKFIVDLENCGSTQPTRSALSFVIATACRSKEVRNATWNELNLEADIPNWTIPKERMKMGLDHVVPLSPVALEILKRMYEYEYNSDYVFPGFKPARPLADMTILKLAKRLGGDITVHGFRTTFRTWAQEKTNVQSEVAEAALAHSNLSSTEAAYARSDLFEKRYDLMKSWSEYIDKKVLT